MDKQNFFKANWDSIFKPVVVLLSICIIIPLALALTNKITKDPIAEQEKKQQSDSMAELFPKAEFDEKGDYAVAKQGDEVIGYVFTTASQKGYGGEVKVMTAITTDGKIKAIKILNVDNETPGLGQNATKESFYGQFAGQPAADLSITKDGGSIEPITGASITSRAVTEAVNEAVKTYEKIKEEK